MSLSLREMQLLAEAEYTVEATRKDLNRLVDFLLSMEEQDEYIDIAFVMERKLPLWIAKQQKVFFVNDEWCLMDIPEEFIHESFGFIRNYRYVYEGRLVYPVMDIRGDVMGFCGWSKFDKTKYLDSNTYGYKAKQTTMYGMEELPNYYKSKEPIYVVEGIVCCLYLRSIGKQSLALLGSSMSKYVIQMLRRFGKRLIIIPDNDAFGRPLENITELAGEHLVEQAKRVLPDALIVQSKVAKDIDDSRLIQDGIYETKLQKDLEMVYQCPFLNFETIRVR